MRIVFMVRSNNNFYKNRFRFVFLKDRDLFYFVHASIRRILRFLGIYYLRYYPQIFLVELLRKRAFSMKQNQKKKQKLIDFIAKTRGENVVIPNI